MTLPPSCPAVPHGGHTAAPQPVAAFSRSARPRHSAFAVALLVASVQAIALEEPLTLAGCARIVDKDRRLECFDRLAAGSVVEGNGKGPPATNVLPQEPANRSDANAGRRSTRYGLSERWELEADDKRGVFAFRPHRENYVLFANYSEHPNAEPYRPFGRLTQGAEISHTEVAFQLGFKMKLLERAFDSPLDVWFGYTQQSFWQAYNPRASSPFRETDYQPELMAVAPLDVPVFGLRARFINVGLLHESNGQLSTLSRSWNRIYAQVGLERGDFTLLGRVWGRIGSIDDNSDIYDYIGHGDVVAAYRWRGHDFSALVRHNWNTGRGALRLGWAFPVVQNLKGYVQVFSGYGDSLIDYNAYQRTVGVGVLIDF